MSSRLAWVYTVCSDMSDQIVRVNSNRKLYQICIASHNIMHAISCELNSEKRQNLKGDLTKFYEIFLNITLSSPQHSLKYFVFHVRSL